MARVFFVARIVLQFEGQARVVPLGADHVAKTVARDIGDATRLQNDFLDDSL